MTKQHPAKQRTAWQRVARRIRVPLGFVFAVVFLCFAQPSGRTLALSLLLVLPGLWLRGYASGYVKKNAELTMTGPYAYTRNPLYLGSMMIAFGFAAAAGRWELVLALAVLFLLIYWPTIRSEEEFLRGVFPSFDEYAARVPRLLPRPTPARLGQGGAGEFSLELYRRHREYNASMGAAVVYAVLLAKLLFAVHGIGIFFPAH